MALTKLSDISGGRHFFKPKDHETAHVILIEPKSIERDVVNTFKGITNTRDEATVDLSIFETPASLAAGTPEHEHKGAKLTHGSLVNTASRALGGAFAARVELITTQKGNTAWVFDPAPNDVEAAVGEYLDQREAAVAAAIADAPDDF